MALRKTSTEVTNLHFSQEPAKARKKIRHFGTSMCREVRLAHFKSLFYISSIGFVILGIIAWLSQ